MSNQAVLGLRSLGSWYQAWPVSGGLSVPLPVAVPAPFLFSGSAPSPHPPSPGDVRPEARIPGPVRWMDALWVSARAWRAWALHCVLKRKPANERGREPTLWLTVWRWASPKAGLLMSFHPLHNLCWRARAAQPAGKPAVGLGGRTPFPHSPEPHLL